MIDGETTGQHAACERTGNRSFGDEVGAGFERNAAACFKLIRRPSRAHEHGAAGDIASVKRALRAAQNFNGFEIECIGDRAGVHAEINAVDKHADGGIDGCDRRIHANAADGKIGDAARGADVLKLHVWHCVAEALQILDVPRLQVALAERVDRHRQILRARFAVLVSCNDDFVSRLRPYWRNASAEQHKCKANALHGPPRSVAAMTKCVLIARERLSRQ